MRDCYDRSQTIQTDAGSEKAKANDEDF
jgi:hypothetical protein